MTAPGLMAMARIIQRADDAHRQDIVDSCLGAIRKEYHFSVILPHPEGIEARPAIQLEEIRGSLKVRISIETTKEAAIAEAFATMADMVKGRAWKLIKTMTGEIPVEVR